MKPERHGPAPTETAVELTRDHTHSTVHLASSTQLAQAQVRGRDGSINCTLPTNENDAAFFWSAGALWSAVEPSTLAAFSLMIMQPHFGTATLDVEVRHRSRIAVESSVVKRLGVAIRYIV